MPTTYRTVLEQIVRETAECSEDVAELFIRFCEAEGFPIIPPRVDSVEIHPVVALAYRREVEPSVCALVRQAFRVTVN